MDVNLVVERIVEQRNKRGYSYENMADELGLSVAAYRKIEMGETKLTLERLYRISEILEFPLKDLLGLEVGHLQQNNYNNENVYQQKIEHFYQENKEITELLIRSKDELIEHLKSEITILRALIS